MADSRAARLLCFVAMAMAVGGAALGVVPGAAPAAPFALSIAVVLVGYAAWRIEKTPNEREEDEETRFRRELSVNASSLVLVVVFLLLGLTELLAIPAAMGKLVVFSAFGLGFVTYYPVLLAFLLVALAGAVVLASQRPRPEEEMSESSRNVGYLAASLTGLFLLGTITVATGALESLEIRAERSVFVLAAGLVSLFVFVKTWLRLPTYREVTRWLERDERMRASNLLQKLVLALLSVCAVGLVLMVLGATGVVPRTASLAGMGLAMLGLLAATFNVGVSHVVPELEMDGDVKDARRKRKVILSAASLALGILAGAIGLLTIFATLAQAGGVTLFHFLLDAFARLYPIIFAVALVPLMATVLVRTRIRSEVRYSERLQAIALGMATLTLILTFFGVFIGSGLAEGSGLQIENAVLVLGGAFLALIHFVKARTALPGIVGMIREAIQLSEAADKPMQETLKSRMIATYVIGLVFVLSFIGYVVASALGTIPKPGSSLGSDVSFFLYVLAGIVLLVIVVMRYFQSINIDQRWAAKKEKAIGKKRLTSEQVTRYLILGFSIGFAALLFLTGALVQAGKVTSIGPLELGKKYGTDFFVFAILIGIGPYGWYQMREARRIEAIDTKFPEFLRDLAESQRSGMTLTEAVATAAQGSYGGLTDEVRKMAIQIEWGVAFSDALERFAKRVGTPLINRTVALIVQASNAGGNVVDVLTAAADDARELQQIVKERKQSMSIYVMIIYIAFAVFVGVIAVLNAQFIPEVAKAVSKADGVSIGGLNFRAFDQDDFKTLFFHAAIIQGLGGGMVGGVMSGGKIIHGLRHSFILVTVSWVLFRLVIG